MYSVTRCNNSERVLNKIEIFLNCNHLKRFVVYTFANLFVIK